MEHRCAVRKPIALNVTLNYRGLGLISGKTQDVGLGGMFINVGRVQLAVNALVDITFPVKCPTKSMQCKAQALVVHLGRTVSVSCSVNWMPMSVRC